MKYTLLQNIIIKTFQICTERIPKLVCIDVRVRSTAYSVSLDVFQALSKLRNTVA